MPTQQPVLGLLVARELCLLKSKPPFVGAGIQGFLFLDIILGFDRRGMVGTGVARRETRVEGVGENGKEDGSKDTHAVSSPPPLDIKVAISPERHKPLSVEDD